MTAVAYMGAMIFITTKRQKKVKILSKSEKCR